MKNCYHTNNDDIKIAYYVAPFLANHNIGLHTYFAHLKNFPHHFFQLYQTILLLLWNICRTYLLYDKINMWHIYFINKKNHTK